MALSFVQRKDANGTGLTQTVVFTSNVTAGNLIVLAIGGGDTGMIPSSITDTRGNSYTLRVPSTNNDGSSLVIALYDCVSVGTGPNTITVVVNQDGGFIELTAWEFHTTSGSWTFDQGNITAGTSATATSGSVTTTQANEVMVGYGMLFGTAGTYASGWTGTTDASGNASAYNIVAVTGANTFTITQGSSQRFLANIATYYASGGPTNVNATVAIAAKATATLNPRIIKDAVFVCAAGAAGTFRCSLGAFGTLILQGKATGTTFTGRNTRLQGAIIQSRASGTFLSFVTHSATVAIAGTASNSRFGPLAAPTIRNATVHLFGFAANNIAITQLAGRATLVLRSSVPIDQVSINGRATLTLAARVTSGTNLFVQSNARLILNATVTGVGLVSGTVVIQGGAAFSSAGRLIQNAQVVIEAGNLTFTLVEAKVAMAARSAVNLNPLLTHSTQVLIKGRASLAPNVTLGGTFNIFSGVHFAGRAAGTFAVPSSQTFATLNVLGQATLSPSVTNIVSLSATVAIQGRARAPFAAFVQGSTFNNGVLNISGKARFTASAFRLVQPSVRISGLANLMLFPGDIIRGAVRIQGFATLTAQVAKNPLQWSSSNTLQYKVWQYNSESMVRVLGSSWTVNSIGLSFQAVVLEVVQTEAGWGD